MGEIYVDHATYIPTIFGPQSFDWNTSVKGLRRDHGIESYAHPEYLVDAAWVDAHKSDEDVVILTARSRPLSREAISPARISA
ncbi:MAG: hypothetical protein CM1200mP27_07630 [Chloroflexota bacterium]|nr:MAG: hypothetical protein CM1200mP27_07630 [Chloroflexota bacterium]